MIGFNNRSVEVENNGGWWQTLDNSFTLTTKKSQSSSMLEPKIVNSTDVRISVGVKTGTDYRITEYINE